MKTINKTCSTAAPNSATPQTLLPFGAGYLRYLSCIAALDDEEPACLPSRQPVRYLSAIEPLGTEETAGQASDRAETSAKLRTAVVALRDKILCA